MHVSTTSVPMQISEQITAPKQLVEALPCSLQMSQTVAQARATFTRILRGEDTRLALIIGPCSVHDSAAALEYAQRLKEVRERYRDCLEIIMRVYFEKPRSVVGWKGYISDPHLDGTGDINEGLYRARALLRDIVALGVPPAVEFLDILSPHYLADLVAWGAIGARTTESQVHRELASGLGCPIGFKNATSGDFNVAIDAVRAAAHSHRFISINQDGRIGIATTSGNPDGHIILRGGKTPNYDVNSIAAASNLLQKANLYPRVIVDVSHGNSEKKPENQPKVAETVASYISSGNWNILGLMVESHLEAGRQDVVSVETLKYGQSITDGCIGWDVTLKVIQRLAEAARQRQKQGQPQLTVEEN